ncbi:unnamed protein product [Rhodiola kirilowii]
MDNNNHRSTKLHRRTRSRSRSTAAKSASQYDDVFASPAISPSEEDYSEIFGGFHGRFRGASAIPILDLPPVDDDAALFDFRFFDYSEVFGGFQALDYAVPFQELFRRPNGGYASSDDDAWTRVETECLSEGWDGSSYSSKCKSSGNETNQQTVDDAKQVNMCYHLHQTYGEGVSNTAHVAPVQAVPGYAFVIDQNPRMLADDDDGKVIKRGKRERELSERLTPYRVKDELDKGDVRNGSRSDEKYVTISEINLRTQPSEVPPPSRPPPIFDARDGYSGETTSSPRATYSSNFLSESISGNNSPTFVDVEVDARFSAAARGAAVTESLKYSQAKLETVEVISLVKNVVKSRVKVSSKDEVKCNVAVNKPRKSYEDQENGACSVGDDVQRPTGKENYSALPEIMVLNPIFNLSGKKKGKQSWSSEDSCEAHSTDNWAEVPEFFELVRSGMTKTTKQENGENITLQNRMKKEHGKEEKRVPNQEKVNIRVSIMSNKSEDHVKISEAVSEVTEKDENDKESHVSLHTAHQCVKVERQVSEDVIQMEDDISIEIMKNKHDIEKELNKIRRKVKLGEERMEDTRKVHVVCCTETFVAAEDDGRVNDDLLRGQGEMSARENCQQATCMTTESTACEIRLRNLDEQTHSEMREEVYNEQQNERVKKTKIEQEKQEPFFQEAFEDEGNIDKQKKPDELGKKEKQLKEELTLEETKRRAREIFEMEENERRKKEEEYVAQLMEASENEAEEMLKEALEVVNKRILIDDFERAVKEKKMKNATEQLQNQKISDQLSQSKDDMIFEHTNEEEPEVIKKPHGDPKMASSRQISNFTPDIDVGVEATNRIKTEKLSEEILRVLSSVCDSEQKSTHEVITVFGKKSNYKCGADGGVNSEYIPVSGTNEQLSAIKENKALPTGTNMSSNASGEAALHLHQIGVKINNKLPSTADSRNPQEEIKVGKVAMPEKAQAQTKMASHDELNIDKGEVNGQMSNSRSSESTKSYMSYGRKQTQTLSQQSKTSQIVGGKEKSRNGSITEEEREKVERLRREREREIELERLKKVEEEWEREREREKDRVAFESVTRNVRESAYAGSREKAAMDKATAETRQKDIAKNRERLEKACVEAKTRQEQSAVERVNSEARERADKSISSSAAVYPYPSTSMYTTDIGGGIDGESTQRCKARLERHRRTAERAAKALAEKNTRDLIAQREQAERHRLAETLDTEVKRWSNGKQGNLRALLSTLQYILGAESGWQPVPLTDVITSAAVKKAYRKATLCVHPDKLQQRRATIQQKYICEKVFDLLKEAWNRFNSEER